MCCEVYSRLLFLIPVCCLLWGVGHKQLYACSLKPSIHSTILDVSEDGLLVLEDGREVRFANLLMPYAPSGIVESKTWPAMQESLKALRKQFVGKGVFLALGKYKVDRYGKLVAQVYLKNHSGYLWGQELLVRQGLARVSSFGSHFMCLKELLKIEVLARAERSGIWNNHYYRLYSASDIFNLKQKNHQFQIIEGRVLDVSEKRGKVFINFGKNWKRDFTIKITRKDKKKFLKQGKSIKAYKGRKVRVRGWLRDHFGPLIQVNHPDEIEIID